MKINWSKYLFFKFRRRRKTLIIGHNIFSKCRFKGKFILIDGLCIGMKSKKQKLLTSSYYVKNFSETIFYIKFPVFLSGAMNVKVTGFSYGFNISSSKLLESRLKK